MLAWENSGFSLDATVRVIAYDRAGVERLMRYCALLATSGLENLCPSSLRICEVGKWPGPAARHPDGSVVPRVDGSPTATASRCPLPLALSMPYLRGLVTAKRVDPSLNMASWSDRSRHRRQALAEPRSLGSPPPHPRIWSAAVLRPRAGCLAPIHPPRDVGQRSPLPPPSSSRGVRDSPPAQALSAVPSEHTRAVRPRRAEVIRHPPACGPVADRGPGSPRPRLDRGTDPAGPGARSTSGSPRRRS